jgi:hypothetical protein
MHNSGDCPPSPLNLDVWRVKKAILPVRRKFQCQLRLYLLTDSYLSTALRVVSASESTDVTDRRYGHNDKRRRDRAG